MKAANYVVDFAANSQPIEGLEGIDVAHNIGATANAVVKALIILRDHMRTDLTELFTRPENTPTPTVIAQPRLMWLIWLSCAITLTFMRDSVGTEQTEPFTRPENTPTPATHPCQV